jgi:hypothetical protein
MVFSDPRGGQAPPEHSRVNMSIPASATAPAGQPVCPRLSWPLLTSLGSVWNRTFYQQPLQSADLGEEHLEGEGITGSPRHLGWLCPVCLPRLQRPRLKRKTF